MAILHPLTRSTAPTRRTRAGVPLTPVALVAFAALTVGLLIFALWLTISPPQGVLQLIDGTFHPGSRADFTTSSTSRFAPQHPAGQPGHPAP